MISQERIKELLYPNDDWHIVIAYCQYVYQPWIVRIENLANDGKVLGIVAFGAGDTLEKAFSDVEEIVKEKRRKHYQ